MSYDYLLRLAHRREGLQRRGAPPCPRCREGDQIQLRYWMSDNVVWRCRICRHAWEETVPFEPAPTP